MNNERRRAITLTGAMGVGKGVAGTYLAEKYGFTPMTFSSVLKEEARKRGLEPKAENLYAIHDDLRAQYGDQVLAERAVAEIEANGVNKIIFDGPRYPAQVEYVKSTFPGTLHLHIESDNDTRKQRILERARAIDPSDEAELSKLLTRDFEDTLLCKSVPGVITLENNAELAEFQEALDAIVRPWMSE